MTTPLPGRKLRAYADALVLITERLRNRAHTSKADALAAPDVERGFQSGRNMAYAEMVDSVGGIIDLLEIDRRELGLPVDALNDIIAGTGAQARAPIRADRSAAAPWAAFEVLLRIQHSESPATLEEQRVLYDTALYFVEHVGVSASLDEAAPYLLFIEAVAAQLMRAIPRVSTIDIDREFLRDFDRLDDAVERTRVATAIRAGKRYGVRDF